MMRFSLSVMLLLSICSLLWGSSVATTSGASLDENAQIRINAAKRLINAVSSQIEKCDDISSLKNDLQLLLAEVFVKQEIEDLIAESWIAAKGAGVEECPALIDKKVSNDTDNITDENDELSYDESLFFADRHAKRVLETYQNHDCLKREFDVSDLSKFSIQEAVEVFQTCRILVLRNVFTPEAVEELKEEITNYIGGVYTGKINSDGTTTYGGDYFILNEHAKRWNFLMPRNLVASEVFANDKILELLYHPAMLGDELVVNHMGGLVSEAGALAQSWHADSDYIYETGRSEMLGVGGHDLPPFAVNMFTPLLDITSDHGPTEFCLGTSNFRGQGKSLNVHDKNILENKAFQGLHKFERKKRKKCPDGFSRIPLVGKGDVVLFDYMVTHRGGRNKSNDLRSMLFIVYSRKWFRDSNFDAHWDQEELDRLTEITRFAVLEKRPKGDETCTSDEDPACADEALPPLESMSGFLKRRYAESGEE